MVGVGVDFIQIQQGQVSKSWLKCPEGPDGLSVQALGDLKFCKRRIVLKILQLYLEGGKSGLLHIWTSPDLKNGLIKISSLMEIMVSMLLPVVASTVVY